MPRSIIHNTKRETCASWRMPSVDADVSLKNMLEQCIVDHDNNLTQEQKSEQIHQQAFDQGYQDGIAKAQQEAAELQQQLQQTISLFSKPLQLIDQEVEQIILQLVLTLSKQVLHQDLAQSPEKILKTIESVKALLDEVQIDMGLSLSPSDHEFIQQQISSGKLSILNAKLTPDEGLSAGECVLSGSNHTIYSTLMTHLSQVVPSVWMNNEGNHVSDTTEE